MRCLVERGPLGGVGRGTLPAAVTLALRSPKKAIDASDDGVAAAQEFLSQLSEVPEVRKEELAEKLGELDFELSDIRDDFRIIPVQAALGAALAGLIFEELPVISLLLVAGMSYWATVTTRRLQYLRRRAQRATLILKRAATEK